MKLITTSWDDGYPLDSRLANLLVKYNLAATFYIPKANSEYEVMNEHSIRELANHFEIGGHTLSHIRLNTITGLKLQEEIDGCYKWLSDLLGYRPVSFCPPGGKYSKESLSVLQRSNFKVIRTTELLSIKDTINSNKLIPTTMQMYNHTAGSYLRNLGRRYRILSVLRWGRYGYATDLERLTENYLNLILKEGGCFHLWGHSWEIDAFNLWDKLENVCRLLSNINEFTYVQNKHFANPVAP